LGRKDLSGVAYDTERASFSRSVVPKLYLEPQLVREWFEAAGAKIGAIRSFFRSFQPRARVGRE
jgi:hypothetical protein